MSEAAKWYVIHTYSGYENKVAQNIEKVVENRKLHDLIHEVRVPTETVTEITDGKTKEVERKTYPGYVLVKMVVTDDSWYVVRNTRGCTGFVGPASEPTPLSDDEVKQLFGIDVSSVQVNFKEGDSVRISGTAMDGFIGIVQSINLDEKIVGYIKLQIAAGKATPAPPVGPALGQHGVNIMAFTKEFNERTKNDIGMIIPVVITVYADRSFTFITKTPPAAVLIKKACNINSGSGVPNKTKVANITKEQIQKIAEQKMPDLNAGSLEAAMSMIAGTARSMGVVVVD